MPLIWSADKDHSFEQYLLHLDAEDIFEEIDIIDEAVGCKHADNGRDQAQRHASLNRRFDTPPRLCNPLLPR